MNAFQNFFSSLGLCKDSKSENSPLQPPLKSKPENSGISGSVLNKPIVRVLNKQLIRSKTEDGLCQKKFDLTKKVLVLDLDNTMLYASSRPVSKKHITVTVEKPEKSQKYYVILRPGLLRALNNLSRFYNICVFTACDTIYTRKVVEATGICEFLCRLYDRSSCCRLENGYLIKDLWAAGFDKESTILVDDSCDQTANYVENAIDIKPFTGESMDREFLKLSDFLEKLHTSKDVRPVAKKFEEYLAECQKKYEDEVDLFKQEDERIGQSRLGSVIVSQRSEGTFGRRSESEEKESTSMSRSSSAYFA